MKLHSFSLSLTLHRLYFKPAASFRIKALLQFENQQQTIYQETIPFEDGVLQTGEGTQAESQKPMDRQEEIIVEKEFTTTVKLPFSDRTNIYYMKKGYLLLVNAHNDNLVGSVTLYLNKQIGGCENVEARISKSAFKEAYLNYSLKMTLNHEIPEELYRSSNPQDFSKALSSVSGEGNSGKQSKIHRLPANSRVYDSLYVPQRANKNLSLKNRTFSPGFSSYQPRLKLIAQDQSSQPRQSPSIHASRIHSREKSRGYEQSEQNTKVNVPYRGSQLFQSKNQQQIREKAQLESQLRYSKQKVENLSHELDKANRRQQITQESFKTQIQQLNARLTASESQKSKMLYEQNIRLVQYESEERNKLVAFHGKQKVAQEQYHTAVKKMDHLQRDLKSVNEKKAQLDIENAELKTEKKNFITQLEKAETEIESLKIELEQLKVKYNNEENTRILYQEKLANSQGMLEEKLMLKKQISEKDQKEQMKNNELHSLQQHFQQTKIKLVEVNKELSQKEHAFKDAQRELQQKIFQLEDQKNKESRLLEQLHHVKDQKAQLFNEFKEEKKNSERKIKDLMAKLAAESQKVKELSERDMDKEIMMEELNKANQQLYELENELEEKYGDIKLKQTELEQLSKKLTLANQKINQQNTHLTEYAESQYQVELAFNQERTQKNLQLNNLNRQIEQLESHFRQNGHNKATIVSLEQELKSCTARLKDKSQELSKAQSTVLSLEESNLKLNIELEAIQQDKDMLAQQNQQLLKELETMRKSQSQYQEETKSSNSNLQKLKLKIKKLEDKLQQKEQQLISKQKDFKKKQEKHEQVRKQNKNIFSQFLGSLNLNKLPKNKLTQLKSEDQELNKLMEATIQKLDQERINYQAEIQKIREEVKSYQKKYEVLMAEKGKQLNNLHQMLLLKSEEIRLLTEEINTQNETFNETLQIRKKEKSQYEQKIRQLETELKEQSKKLMLSKSENEKLETQLEREKKKVQAFQEKIKIQAEAYKKQKAKIVAEAQNSNSLKKKFDEALQKEKSKLNKQNQQMGELERQIKQLTRQLTEKTSDIEKKIKEHKLVRKNLETKEQELTKSLEERKQLRNDINIKQDEISLLKESHQILQQECSSLHSENKEHHKTVHEQNTLIYKLRSHNNDILDQKNRLSQQFEQLKTSSQNEQKSRNQVRAQLKTLKQEQLNILSQKDKEILILSEQLSKQRISCDRESNNNQSLKSTNHHLKLQVNALQEEVHQFKEQLVSERVEIDGKSDELRDLTKELLQRSTSLTKLEAQNEVYRSQHSIHKQYIQPLLQVSQHILTQLNQYSEYAFMFNSNRKKMLELSANKNISLLKEHERYSRLRGKVSILLNQNKIEIMNTPNIRQKEREKIIQMLITLRTAVESAD